MGIGLLEMTKVEIDLKNALEYFSGEGELKAEIVEQISGVLIMVSFVKDNTNSISQEEREDMFSLARELSVNFNTCIKEEKDTK